MHIPPHMLTWLIVVLLLLGGAVMYGLHKRRRDSQRRNRESLQIPETWPFGPRQVVGEAERELWQWLSAALPEHQVLVKLPVTRFVMPFHPDDARVWFQVLSSVYCTFTICAGSGRVLGCLDVVGPAGLPRSNRIIKQTLLAQCGIGYWTVPQGQMPDIETLRADLKAHYPKTPDAEPPVSEFQQIRNVRYRLHQTLGRNRVQLHHSGEAVSQNKSESRLPGKAALEMPETSPPDPFPATEIFDFPPPFSPPANHRAGLNVF